MSRFYTVPYTGTVTNAGGNAELLEFLPGDDKPTRLRGILLSQSSEVGDAAEEGLAISINRLTATVTSSNGTSVTPTPMSTADAAYGGTTECNGATIATTSGSTVIWGNLAWNIRNSPFDMWFPDERFAMCIVQGEGGFVRQDTTAADDYTGSFTFWIEELA